MSNMFKANSRFSSLIDDIPTSNKKENKKENKNITYQEDKFNSFKSGRRDDNFRSYEDKERDREKYKKEKENEIKIQKEFEEREKERKKQELLSSNNFPELIKIIKNDNTTKGINMNFIEKINTKTEIKNNIDPDLVNLKPGWLLIKKDKNTGKIIMKNHPENTFFFEKELEKSENEICYDIVDSLVRLHEKRTEKYIELYGYDIWEKMFKFPNWNEDNYSDDEDENENEEYEEETNIYENEEYYN